MQQKLKEDKREEVFHNDIFFVPRHFDEERGEIC